MCVRVCVFVLCVCVRVRMHINPRGLPVACAASAAAGGSAARVISTVFLRGDCFFTAEAGLAEDLTLALEKLCVRMRVHAKVQRDVRESSRAGSSFSEISISYNTLMFARVESVSEVLESLA